MTDLAKEQLSVGGQLFLIFSVALPLLFVGVWFLANARKPGKISKLRTLSGFSPRGEKETQILARVLGVGFTVIGAAAFIDGVVITFR
ncbi:hypothetical protein I3F58_08565 [Streptomyces sp. MUM 203J]|uniref:hypothetical protein n=1 Tax=Streptomyces sp. MUM 203J TaxID=2791990 RepID=UPI001F037931|nr:hypothetical protein [Streptomyces sp. MUM 203J]MCH0539620.1 hypothetical protein [Streptomyces sp. MUM 203J]